jgi:prepilin-type N-terminal cleavage/methylation domain-containing protein
MRGFTLIEMIIYMAISSMLCTAVITLSWILIDQDAHASHIVEQELEILYANNL